MERRSIRVSLETACLWLCPLRLPHVNNSLLSEGKSVSARRLKANCQRRDLPLGCLLASLLACKFKEPAKKFVTHTRSRRRRRTIGGQRSRGGKKKSFSTSSTVECELLFSLLLRGRVSLEMKAVWRLSRSAS